MNTILQVPVKKDVRDQAAKAAEKMGFSSLQEPVRIFLSQLATGRTVVKFEQEVHLSERNKKRYEQMIDDVKQGKVKTQAFSDVRDLIKHLDK